MNEIPAPPQPPEPGVNPTVRKEKHDDDGKPWWNSADKMGGLMATSLCLIALVFIAILLWGWAWHLAFG